VRAGAPCLFRTFQCFSMLKQRNAKPPNAPPAAHPWLRDPGSCSSPCWLLGSWENLARCPRDFDKTSERWPDKLQRERVEGHVPFPAKGAKERKFPVGSLLLSVLLLLYQCCICHRFLLAHCSALCPLPRHSTTGGTQSESAREQPAASHSVWLCRIGLAPLLDFPPPPESGDRLRPCLRTSRPRPPRPHPRGCAFPIAATHPVVQKPGLDLKPRLRSFSPPPPQSSPPLTKYLDQSRRPPFPPHTPHPRVSQPALHAYKNGIGTRTPRPNTALTSSHTQNLGYLWSVRCGSLFC
jgi:hypothetical protein